MVKCWPTDIMVLDSPCPVSRNVSNHNRVPSHNLSLSPSHQPDMTNTVKKEVK